jgi:hypothetical protein
MTITLFRVTQRRYAVTYNVFIYLVYKFLYLHFASEEAATLLESF